MSEQILRITTLQSRLDEQRQRAEELQRAGTSDLNLKVYDLQTELTTVKETLSSRDKQITVLKNHLAQSKEIIDKQEAEICLSTSSIGSPADSFERNRLEKLEAQIAAKDAENKKLKDKMRTEMITKVALPDLMETMLADKTDEIDYLKEQLEGREKELQSLRDRQLFGRAEEKLNLRFSRELESISEYDDNDYIRKLPEAAEELLSGAVSSTLTLVNFNLIYFINFCIQ